MPLSRLCWTPLLRSAPPSPPPAAPVQKNKPQKLSYKEQRELEGMESAIADAESAVADLEMIFSDPDFYAKYGSRSAELQTELDAARAEVSRLYERWDELESKKELLEKGV